MAVLAQTWLEAVEEARGQPLEDRALVAHALAGAVRRFGGFASQLDGRPLAQFLAARLTAAEAKALHWEDLVLAAGCVQGLAAAQRVAVGVVEGAVRSALRRRAENDADVDEATQRAVARILLGPSPKIGEYQGRGPLVAWATVVAVREFLNTIKPQHPLPPAEAEQIFASLVAADRPELDAIRRQAQQKFGRALEFAVAALSTDERRLLRARFVEDLDLRVLAERLAVDRATVVRRLARARERLRRELNSLLAEELGVAPAELHSLLAVIRSQPRFDLAEAFASLRAAATKP